MSKPKSENGKEATRQAAYKLPNELILKIRMEAARRGIYPAHVVRERLLDSFEKKPDSTQPAA